MICRSLLGLLVFLYLVCAGVVVVGHKSGGGAPWGDGGGEGLVIGGVVVGGMMGVQKMQWRIQQGGWVQGVCPW